MSGAVQGRGGAAVGLLTELEGVEAASVIYLRLWSDGPDGQAMLWSDLSRTLGRDRGRRTLQAFEQLCRLCARHGRRPLMRHAVECKCLGADEACFANFIACAATGAQEDAMLIATLLVRADVAAQVTSLATDFGLGLRRMRPAAPRDLDMSRPPSARLH
jgi:hypothetical protein